MYAFTEKRKKALLFFVLALLFSSSSSYSREGFRPSSNELAAILLLLSGSFEEREERKIKNKRERSALGNSFSFEHTVHTHTKRLLLELYTNTPHDEEIKEALSFGNSVGFAAKFAELMVQARSRCQTG